MSEESKEKARAEKRELYARRKDMGVCVYCGGLIDNTQYSSCDKCRAEWRERNALYRENLRKLRDKCEVVVPEVKEVPEDHKCWTCVWSRFEGDRFFCPLVGTCVKDEAKQEE